MAEDGIGRQRFVFGFRVAVFLAVAVLASLHQTTDGAVAIRERSAFGMVLVAPFAAGIVAIVRGLSQRRTLHIHDRHVDVLLSIALLGAALAFTALFGPRMWWAQPILRLDILARPLWIAAAYSALFGTRPMLEQLPALGVLGATWPTPYILASPLLPAGTLAPFILSVILSAATSAVLRSRTVMHLVIAAVGASAAFQWCKLGIATPWAAPAVSVVVVILTAALLRQKWIFLGGEPGEHDESGRRPAIDKLSLRSMTPIVLVAALVSLIPSQALAEITYTASTTPPRECASVPGWQLQGTEIHRSPLGHGAPATVNRRCRYRVPQNGEMRTIAIDVSGAALFSDLGANPLPALFAGPGRLDPVDRTTHIDGGKADIFDWNDPAIPTEVLVLSWYARSSEPDHWHRVSLIVPDDKRANVEIPDPTGRYGEALQSLIDRVLTVMRTRRDQLQQYSVEPKDLGFAKASAEKLVASWQEDTRR